MRDDLAAMSWAKNVLDVVTDEQNKCLLSGIVCITVD